jgi:hypothetical protein
MMTLFARNAKREQERRDRIDDVHDILRREPAVAREISYELAAHIVDTLHPPTWASKAPVSDYVEQALTKSCPHCKATPGTMCYGRLRIPHVERMPRQP